MLNLRTWDFFLFCFNVLFGKTRIWKFSHIDTLVNNPKIWNRLGAKSSWCTTNIGVQVCCQSWNSWWRIRASIIRTTFTADTQLNPFVHILDCFVCIIYFLELCLLFNVKFILGLNLSKLCVVVSMDLILKLLKHVMLILFVRMVLLQLTVFFFQLSQVLQLLLPSGLVGLVPSNLLFEVVDLGWIGWELGPLCLVVLDGLDQLSISRDGDVVVASESIVLLDQMVEHCGELLTSLGIL